MSYSDPGYPDPRSYRPRPPARASALPLAMAGAALVLAVWMVIDQTGWLRPGPSAEARPVAARGELAPLERSFIEVFERAAPSVAHIRTQSVISNGWTVGQAQGTGSGFVWDESGTVITNFHVIANARRISVSIDRRRFQADVVAGDKNYDIAVLRLRGNVRGLVPLPLGTSADLRVGQTAIAIGNPYGFDQTMTTGIVSALNRTIETREGALGGLIQVDAAINPGNSGGPLLDSAGRLIGITTAIYSPSGANAGIGFAVPVDIVNAIVPGLLGSKVEVPVLGIGNRFERLRYVPFDEFPAIDYSHGAVFTEVFEGFGAAAAGLRPTRVSGDGRVQWGDIIVAIDGREVHSFDELGSALLGKKPGHTARVTVVRGLPESANVETVPVELKANGR